MKEYKVLENICGFGIKNDVVTNAYIRNWFTKKGKEYLIEDGYIKEYSEYPKIISFKLNIDDSIFKINKFKHFNSHESISYSLKEMLYNGACVKNGEFKIYQVAKNENEIFTIGDKVQCVNSNIFTIKKFHYEEDMIYMSFEERDNKIKDEVTIYNKLEPIIQVEGKNLYEEDEYYLVTKDDYKIYLGIVSKSTKFIEFYKRFLTKDSAIEYIKESILKEAKEKGFVKGARYKYLNFTNRYNNVNYLHFQYNEDEDCFILINIDEGKPGGDRIFSTTKGWLAEIIKETKPKLTLGEKEVTIKDNYIYASDGKCTIDEWLQWYEKLMNAADTEGCHEIKLQLRNYETIFHPDSMHDNKIGCIENVNWDQVDEVTKYINNNIK